MKCKSGSNTHLTAYAKIAHSFAAMCKKGLKKFNDKAEFSCIPNSRHKYSHNASHIIRP